jgi:dTDP-glucose pyrophosphorylase
MEEFLGVLFCGGKGTRLREITKYISKSFIPVYDKPVFEFGLEILEKSKIIREIIIFTNKENDELLKNSGYKTIVQDDLKVRDMLSGWEFVKKVTGTGKHGVLIPSDNICDVKIDSLIKKFTSSQSDFLFSLHKVKDKVKLAEMGCYDKAKRKFYYKQKDPVSGYGVIAPYIIRNDLKNLSVKNTFENKNSKIVIHKGYWFDIGDYKGIFDACRWRQKNK